MIISFLQTKGGTGKTTLAKCLAFSRTFRESFDSIGLVELDPQGSIKSWHSQRDNGRRPHKVGFVSLLDSSPEVLKEKLEYLSGMYQVLLLDIPGESTGKLTTRLGASVSDLVLIPMRTSTNDEQSFSDHILPILEKVMAIDPDKGKTFHIVPTFVHPQANPENVHAYFTEIMPDSIGCLNACLPSRSVFENFSREGATLSEYAASVKKNARHTSQVNKAIDDIERIATEILTLTP